MKFFTTFFYTDSLLFITTEEGRARIKADSSAVVYDYMIKDHLGNVRMLLTDEKDTAFYPPATMEDALAADEEMFYSNLNTRMDLPNGYPPDSPTGNAKVAQLSGSYGANKLGPAMLLKVMAGDKFNVSVNSWYYNKEGDPYNPPNGIVSELFNALNNAVGSLPGSKTTPYDLDNAGVFLPGISIFTANQTTYGDNSKPWAYLNWMLFDEQFNYVSGSSGFEQVPAEAVYNNGSNPNNTYPLVQNNLPVTKNGFLYIYVSNETPNINVFFDNLTVTHVRGPLLSDETFYPFGLTMAGISSKAAGKMENRYKFNDGTELNNSFEISLYETDFRLYDPQIGRFVQPDELSEAFEDWSTYTFANDNPILLNDPTGLSSDTVWKDIKEVVVKTQKPKELDSENGQVLPPQSALNRFLWGSTREWNGLWVQPSGYLFFYPDGKPVGALAEFSIPDVGKKGLVKKASGVVGKYLVYRAYKKVSGRLKLYIGKAKGSLSKRYTKKEVDDIAARAIERLDDLPDNATALGVEQAILNLNGGVAATANMRNAAVKEVYVQAGLKWLEANIPNWRDVFIFK